MVMIMSKSLFAAAAACLALAACSPAPVPPRPVSDVAPAIAAAPPRAVAVVNKVSGALAQACAVYENPLVHLGVTAGLSLVPGAAAVQAAVDPWVKPLCNGTAEIAKLTDPTSPAFVLQQAAKVQAAAGVPPA